jgi:hypothetical protein
MIDSQRDPQMLPRKKHASTSRFLGILTSFAKWEVDKTTDNLPKKSNNYQFNIL